MATYVNPAGSPPVMFNGPVSFTRDEVAAACRKWGTSLELQRCPDVDGVPLLWALAGNESSFGANSKPRHELGFCKGRYAENPKVQDLTKRFGHAAHCSFGCTQVMLVNVPGDVVDLGAFDTAEGCIATTVIFLNEVILGRQGARTLEQIGDAYNSGNFRDMESAGVKAYVAELRVNYAVRMPAPRVMPK